MRFIEWTHRRRAEGKHVCFAVVPDGCDAAVGIIQFHALEDDFSVAEWGFALGSAYWGKGLFVDGAQAGARVRVRQRGRAAHGSARRHRERARQRGPAEDGRGAGGRARQSFARACRRYNQYLWSILPSDWRRAKATWGERRLSVH